MPMMRDTLVPLSQRLRQVVDHRPQIGARGERGLHPRKHGGAVGLWRRIPRLAQRAANELLLVALARDETVPLLRKRGAAAGVESAFAQLRERLLDLEHL